MINKVKFFKLIGISIGDQLGANTIGNKKLTRVIEDFLNFPMIGNEYEDKRYNS